MVPLTMSASAISKAIREKKKKMAMDTPEVVQNDPNPAMNAQDVWDTEKHAYVEDMTDSPKKINADVTMMEEPSDDEIRKMDMARMGRLRKYFDNLDDY